MVNFVSFVIIITIFLLFTYIYINDDFPFLVFNKLLALKNLTKVIKGASYDGKIQAFLQLPVVIIVSKHPFPRIKKM